MTPLADPWARMDQRGARRAALERALRRRILFCLLMLNLCAVAAAVAEPLRDANILGAVLMGALALLHEAIRVRVRRLNDYRFDEFYDLFTSLLPRFMHPRIKDPR